ncbi:unnamed protein product [Caenorhabditis angaria]|uniref:G-protein coupled receptors family 1 profile domain-containing protein n=1 Tax=Caenorhabditis angaria TaxID=860376 RepID=A0A9P1N4S6_9PELO|nr:unnamed protein product [Caenorhabditis angaria]
MHDPLLIFLLFSYSTLFIFGFFGNSIIVIITIKNRSLRTCCGILIAFASVFDILLFTTVLNFIFSVFIFEPTQQTCFYMSIPADIGAFTSNLYLLVIGIDRLLSVSKPFFYRTLEQNKKKYIIFMNFIPWSYAIFLISRAFHETDIETKVICLIPSSLKDTFELFTTTSFISNLFVPIIYLSVWFKVKHFSNNKKSPAIFKSLLIIVTMTMLGWTATNMFAGLTFMLDFPADSMKRFQFCCGLFICTSSAFNVFVYYKNCHEYRSKIRALFGFKVMQKTTSSVF